MAPAPGFAQDRDDNNKPKTQDDAKPQDNKAPQNEKAKDNGKAQQQERAQQDQRTKQDEKTQQKEEKNQAKQNQKAQQEQDRNAREQQGNQHPVDNRQDMGRDQNHPAYNRHDMRGNQNQHPAADRGRHIPDDQFRSHFGRQHTFRVQRTQIVNVSQPVVAYGGYSFQLVDPWPAQWSYDDNCYIDYVDGQYFLFDAMHPGVRIAVFVAE
jgi:hypothetical protein